MWENGFWRLQCVSAQTVWQIRPCKILKGCFPPHFVVEKEALDLKGTLCTSAAVRLLMSPFINQLSAWRGLQGELYYLTSQTAASLPRGEGAKLCCLVCLAVKLFLKRCGILRSTSTSEDSSLMINVWCRETAGRDGRLIFWSQHPVIDLQPPPFNEPHPPSFSRPTHLPQPRSFSPLKRL